MTITSGARWSSRRCHNAIPQKALVAVSHRLLSIVYHVLRHGQTDWEPTPTDRHHRRHRRARDRAIHHLRHLGYAVTITPMPAAA